MHEKYKNTEDETLRLNRYLKFSMARKKFNDLVSLKMRQNFDDNDDFGLITKKFWSHVRATANSLKIASNQILQTKPNFLIGTFIDSFLNPVLMILQLIILKIMNFISTLIPIVSLQY